MQPRRYKEIQIPQRNLNSAKHSILLHRQIGYNEVTKSKLKSRAAREEFELSCVAFRLL